MNQNARVDCSNSVNITGLTALRRSIATSMPGEGEDPPDSIGSYVAVGLEIAGLEKGATSTGFFSAIHRVIRGAECACDIAKSSR